jgi:hypothetical protein
MKTKFKVRDKEYEVVLERRAKAEGDKFEPFAATVSGQPGGPVKGTMQFTPEALEAAQKKAAGGGGGASLDDLLAHATARSIAAETVIRKLKPDFSFVVDYRWLD